MDERIDSLTNAVQSSVNDENRTEYPYALQFMCSKQRISSRLGKTKEFIKRIQNDPRDRIKLI